MKKSKFILPVIGLVSVISGVFAFKAQHEFAGRLVCYTTSSGVINHKFLGKNYTTTNSNGFILLCTVPFINGEYVRTLVVAIQ